MCVCVFVFVCVGTFGVLFLDYHLEYKFHE